MSKRAPPLPPPPRIPSPTNTTYSGISNYRTDSYKPIKGRAPSVPTMDPRLVAKIHYDEMAAYLINHLAKEPANARQSAREKLTRLTRQQFQELSTDVYDELLRRKNNSENEEVPFLPVRDDFHPKRNQARQKLATLPKGRFKDLSSDVFHELGRRYPEFKEAESSPFTPMSPGSNYDDMDMPSPDFMQSTTAPLPLKVQPALRSAPASDSGYPGSSSGRRPSEDNYRRRPSEDTYGGDSGYGSARRPSEDGFTPSRRKPSQDTLMTLRNEDRSRRQSPDIIGASSASAARRSFDNEDRSDLGRKTSASVSTTSDSTVSATNAQREVIIPNKSTIAEEDIEVPYGLGRDSGNTRMAAGRPPGTPDARDHSPDRRDANGEVLPSDPDSARSAQTQIGGLSGLTARLRGRTLEEDDEDEDGSVPARSGDEYYDKMSFGRASVASDRSVGVAGLAGRMNSTGSAGRTSRGAPIAENPEGLRREYEFKIATMQNRMTGLERDLEDAGERERRLREEAGAEKVSVLENELQMLKQKAAEQSAVMLALQRELETVREERDRDKEREARRAQQDADELEILRERCEQLEAERINGGGGADPDLVEQLRSDLESLMSELNDLSVRNDELMTAKDSDLAVIQNMDAQLRDYKRKYEAAKTELRSVKATSQLFLPAPKLDSDQLPIGADGGVLDIHMTAFLTATDSLLTVGRSNAPTRVLTPIRAVVNAVTAIIEDLRAYERRPRRRESSEVDTETLRALRERAEATLSNLVTATKTHATSFGMSPVSLLDAAASHLSVTITDIGKTVSIRKATKAEQEQYAAAAPAPAAVNLFSPSLRAVEEVKSAAAAAHQRSTSSASSRRDEYGTSSGAGAGKQPDARMSPPARFLSGRSSVDGPGWRPSSASSSNASSPPPIFDQPRSNGVSGVVSDDSAVAEGPDDAWAELKPYLEAQSESIVYAIQSVLSGVRSPTPSPTLNENLTQIITIVSSIVAVCKDSLPPASAAQGNEILRELSEHANRLSEVQSEPEVTKEARQGMAKSSFAVANAMKGLMKL